MEAMTLSSPGLLALLSHQLDLADMVLLSPERTNGDSGSGRTRLHLIDQCRRDVQQKVQLHVSSCAGQGLAPRTLLPWHKRTVWLPFRIGGDECSVHVHGVCPPVSVPTCLRVCLYFSTCPFLTASLCISASLCLCVCAPFSARLLFPLSASQHVYVCV